MKHRIKLHKTYETTHTSFKIDVDFSLSKGEITGIFGPSGAGKTSILRLLSGLEKPSKGYIQIDEKVWLDSPNNIALKVKDRGLGFVFQKDNLFPNMTVLENLKFALKRKQNEDKLKTLITNLGINKLLQHKPHALSGGQRQIIALARSLVQDPSILLLDEPFSSLDTLNTNFLIQHIIKIHKLYKPTIIIVSHDKEVIKTLCAEVILMHKGHIKRQGLTDEIWPKNHLNEAEITDIEYRDDHIIYRLQYDDKNFMIKKSTSQHQVLKVGDKINLTFE